MLIIFMAEILGVILLIYLVIIISIVLLSSSTIIRADINEHSLGTKNFCPEYSNEVAQARIQVRLSDLRAYLDQWAMFPFKLKLAW